MNNERRTKYHVRKRIFLNRDVDMRAYAIAIVEDTQEIPQEDEGWKSGWIELVLSDCYRHVSYDFNMSSKEARADSLYKIRRIAAVVNAVRDALEIEAKSIDNRQKVTKEAEKPKAKGAAG